MACSKFLIYGKGGQNGQKVISSTRIPNNEIPKNASVFGKYHPYYEFQAQIF